MIDLALSVTSAILGGLIGWHAHAVRERHRKLKELESWQRARKFFSSNTTKT